MPRWNTRQGRSGPIEETLFDPDRLRPHRGAGGRRPRPLDDDEAPVRHARVRPRTAVAEAAEFERALARRSGGWR